MDGQSRSTEGDLGYAGSFEFQVTENSTQIGVSKKTATGLMQLENLKVGVHLNHVFKCSVS